ncbi:MAG: 2-oxoacid:ferredoxin oxidoreductase subunit beta [Desulfobacterales bacterium]|nr:2-oxoacid:ferredoxin oxidoreductase subunit beta [Desulfobacterales bacterium]
MHPLVSKYLRLERMPHMACPGCGIGQVIHSTLIACDDLALTPENTVWVQGVGCSSRITYTLWKGDSIDAHHGRIFAVATGMKMSRPDLNFICFTGDGDCMAIGGNHFLHACRRNLDVTALMFNNAIYGMTGGQVAPTSPVGARTTTTPYGNIEDPLDTVNVAIAAGASYVARWRATDFKQLTKSIKKGIKTKGFSYIEILVQCPTQFGRYVLNTGDPAKIIEWYKENTVRLKKAEKMSPEQLKDKILIGEFAQRKDRTGIVERYWEMVKEIQGERA